MGFVWRRRASWFLLLLAGLSARGIAFAAAAYRADIADLVSGSDRSPVLFSVGLVAFAASLLALWNGVPLRGLLRRMFGRNWVTTAVALGASFFLAALSVLCVCLTLLPA
jgi:hypothetical protein